MTDPPKQFAEADFLESAPWPILRFNPEGLTVFANRRARRFFRVDVEGEEGAAALDRLFASEQAFSFIRELPAAPGASDAATLSHITEKGIIDDGNRPHLWSGSALRDDDGNINGFVLFSRR